MQEKNNEPNYLVSKLVVSLKKEKRACVKYSTDKLRALCKFYMRAIQKNFKTTVIIFNV